MTVKEESNIWGNSFRGLIDEKIKQLEYENRVYRDALEQVADHKNTLYAAISQKALDEVSKNS